MQLDALKEQIREISTICAGVPEEFRQKCFELLMSHLLGGTTAQLADQVGRGPAQALASLTASGIGGAPASAMLTAFLRKMAISGDQFSRVVGMSQGSVVFHREPGVEKVAQAQIEWALLVALRHAITHGGFLVDAEAVRQICQEREIYDRRNFFGTFRRHAEYFRAAPEANGPAQPLSSKGLAALGALIKALADVPRRNH